MVVEASRPEKQSVLDRPLESLLLRGTMTVVSVCIAGTFIFMGLVFPKRYGSSGIDTTILICGQIYQLHVGGEEWQHTATGHVRHVRAANS